MKMHFKNIGEREREKARKRFGERKLEKERVKWKKKMQ